MHKVAPLQPAARGKRRDDTSILRTGLPSPLWRSPQLAIDQLETPVGVLPDDEHVRSRRNGMERVVNPPFDRVFAGSMSLLRAAPESR